MTDTPQPPVPFSQRLTPEVRRAWEAHLAANRRAFEDVRHDQRFFKCDVCAKYTDRPSGRHKKCEEAA